jgi:hypothetical protein
VYSTLPGTPWRLKRLVQRVVEDRASLRSGRYPPFVKEIWFVEIWFMGPWFVGMCPHEATAWFLVSAMLREEVQTRSFFEDKTFRECVKSAN